MRGMISLKKDRNTFFEGSSMNMAFNTPQPQMMPVMMPMGQAQAQASQSFYQTTNTPMMNTMQPTYGTQTYNDSSINELESRMAKIERNMNRLENRISKLEGTTIYSNESYESSNSGMYMV